jgi:hypothetical protein
MPNKGVLAAISGDSSRSRTVETDEFTFETHDKRNGKNAFDPHFFQALGRAGSSLTRLRPATSHTAVSRC